MENDHELVEPFSRCGLAFCSRSENCYRQVVLICLGFLLAYLGYKQTLEPLLMIPMGLGMISVNAGVLFMGAAKTGTIFLDPLVSRPLDLVNIMQIDFLQPIYNLTFSNGLIACLVFMGIGAISDLSFLLAKPLTSMFIAICAELGTLATLPIGVALGLTPREAASIAMVGGADGPMVLYTSLVLAKDLFVPISVVAYLYLSLTYAGYPYLLKLLIPKKYRGIRVGHLLKSFPKVSAKEQLISVSATCLILCLLFPVAAPLFLSFFLGVAVRAAGITKFLDFLEGPVLYGSTFFLGLLLGVLCDAQTMLNPKVLLLLILGIVALLLSGVGGIMGGWIVYFISKRRFNPLIGLAGVSCVPTTAKVAQKAAFEEDPGAVILPLAAGANICGVITSAIIAGIYTTIIPMLH